MVSLTFIFGSSKTVNMFQHFAWDITKSVGAVLKFIQEIVIEWDNESSPSYGFGYDHSYALIFRNGG